MGAKKKNKKMNFFGFAVVLIVLVLNVSCQVNSKRMNLKNMGSVSTETNIEPLIVVNESGDDAMRASSRAQFDIEYQSPTDNIMETATDHVILEGDRSLMPHSKLPNGTKIEKETPEEDEFPLQPTSEKPVKEVRLADARQKLDMTRSTLEKQKLEAERILKELHTKKAFLDNLNAQIEKQKKELENEKKSLIQKENDLDNLKTDLEARVRQISKKQKANSAVAAAVKASTLIETDPSIISQLELNLEMSKDISDLPEEAKHELGIHQNPLNIASQIRSDKLQLQNYKRKNLKPQSKKQ
eukprot:c17016_g1_i1.p1 GENE.c17016_g1_i1~~c17016_g1_i1.p1  ORF type:complete len:299 (+),score=134.23 c17016_g1_i1:2-898(+)